jgi:hypothetical protein
LNENPGVLSQSETREKTPKKGKEKSVRVLSLSKEQQEKINDMTNGDSAVAGS